jgi:hypothetical protein
MMDTKHISTQASWTAGEGLEVHYHSPGRTGTVQECELPKQPGEVSQGPANLLTFFSTRREEKDITC